MPEALTLVLPIQLKSKNDRDKLHYRQRSALKKSYQDIVTLKHQRKTPTPTVKQRAVVTRIKGPRERDWDERNIGAGTAIELIDALTASGYWVDDTPKWLETRFAQARSKTTQGPAVVVEIFEVAA